MAGESGQILLQLCNVAGEGRGRGGCVIPDEGAMAPAVVLDVAMEVAGAGAGEAQE